VRFSPHLHTRPWRSSKDFLTLRHQASDGKNNNLQRTKPPRCINYFLKDHISIILATLSSQIVPIVVAKNAICFSPSFIAMHVRMYALSQWIVVLLYCCIVVLLYCCIVVLYTLHIGLMDQWRGRGREMQWRETLESIFIREYLNRLKEKYIFAESNNNITTTKL